MPAALTYHCGYIQNKTEESIIPKKMKKKLFIKG
jgi:hypothetical protein